MVGGTALAVNGADNFSTGFRQLWTGEGQTTAIAQAAGDVVALAGGSPELAQSVTDITNMAQGAAGGAGVGNVAIRQSTKGAGAAAKKNANSSGKDGTRSTASKSDDLIRQKYRKEVKALKEKADKMRAEGGSSEEIARELHKNRRDLGIKYKDLTPSDELVKIHARNLDKYGDKLGPSIDWLRSKGKTWDQIIESAQRTGGKDLGY